MVKSNTKKLMNRVESQELINVHGKANLDPLHGGEKQTQSFKILPSPSTHFIFINIKKIGLGRIIARGRNVSNINSKKNSNTDISKELPTFTTKPLNELENSKPETNTQSNYIDKQMKGQFKPEIKVHNATPLWRDRHNKNQEHKFAESEKNSDKGSCIKFKKIVLPNPDSQTNSGSDDPKTNVLTLSEFLTSRNSVKGQSRFKRDSLNPVPKDMDDTDIFRSKSHDSGRETFADHSQDLQKVAVSPFPQSPIKEVPMTTTQFEIKAKVLHADFTDAFDEGIPIKSSGLDGLSSDDEIPQKAGGLDGFSSGDEMPQKAGGLDDSFDGPVKAGGLDDSFDGPVKAGGLDDSWGSGGGGKAGGLDDDSDSGVGEEDIVQGGGMQKASG